MIEYRFNISICLPCLYPSLKKLPIKQAFVCLLRCIWKYESLDMDGSCIVILPVCYIELCKNLWNFRDLLKIIFCWFKIFRFLGSRILSMYSFTFDSILSRSIRKLFLISSDKSLDGSNNSVFCKKFSKMVPAFSTFIFAARPWMWMHLVYCG